MLIQPLKFRGAIRVYSVDHVPERLEKAKSIGAIPINFSDGDPVAQILKFEPNGVDRSCDCVGFECVNADGKNIENLVLTQAVNITRTGGGLGIIGVYTPKDSSKHTIHFLSKTYVLIILQSHKLLQKQREYFRSPWVHGGLRARL